MVALKSWLGEQGISVRELAAQLDLPLKTEQELRRWMDYTADPEVFARWLEWAMNYTDPVEDSP
jgi:hypothetical protein